MTPGALDQRISIESQSTTTDGYGGGALVWTQIAEVWAAVKPLTGREKSDNIASVESPALYRFTIRRRSDVTDTMSISWNSQRFNIRFVADPGARALYMTIDAERSVAV